MSKKFEVKIESKLGTCESSLFEKMAKKGDITATKIGEVLNCIVTITGAAKCHITTEDNDFEINYIDTNELGLISTGSDVFLDSVIDYWDEIGKDFDKFIITEIKTKKGKTYKAVPKLGKEMKIEKNEEETTDELPFN